MPSSAIVVTITNKRNNRIFNVFIIIINSLDNDNTHSNIDDSTDDANNNDNNSDGKNYNSINKNKVDNE